ncbi:MAG: KTSC domain-containing protein [Candidatus Eisenbacteria bacterium]
MIQWKSVTGSSRIVAEAYDAEAERIYVRFPNGIEWWYAACPRNVWEAFSAFGQSRGQYIHQVLNHKPNGRHAG